MSLGKGTQESKDLKYIVDRVGQLQDEQKTLGAEIKDLEGAAWDKAGVPAKVLKQMVKEAAYDEAKRLAQKAHEDMVDQCRHALEMQLDMTLKGGKGKKPVAEAKRPQPRSAKPKYKGKKPAAVSEKEPALQM